MLVGCVVIASENNQDVANVQMNMKQKIVQKKNSNTSVATVKRTMKQAPSHVRL